MDSIADLHSYLESFVHGEHSQDTGMLHCTDNTTKVEIAEIDGTGVRKYINEFWTSKQRQASSIHELSYRACFKPQLPGFFIELLSEKGSMIYDPFSGRGTTVVEAGIRGRTVVSNDINPLSQVLTRPRFEAPTISQIKQRLSTIRIEENLEPGIDLSMFFHEKTLDEILSLKEYLREKSLAGLDDNVDRWIAMVATNRLTGHSRGFFSVYTLPPNQAVSPGRQKKINQARNQTPEQRDVIEIITKKSASLLRSVTRNQLENLTNAGRSALFLNRDARHTPEIPSDSIQLVVTSPPFLDVVQYYNDNWLRLWFNSISASEAAPEITMARKVGEWSVFIRSVFQELYRVVKHKGWVAFEVGEVRNRTVNLDEHVVPIGIDTGFECHGIVVNSQKFSKTSNIWGIKNMQSGTNSNRIVLFRKT